jgi:hypothetical protein
MTQLTKRVQTVVIVLGILFAPLPRSVMQAQTRQQPTEQQMKDHFFERMTARLRIKRKSVTGWQPVYTTKKNTTVFGFVRSGRVVSMAIGKSNMRNSLVQFAPNGDRRGANVSTAGAGVASGGGVLERPGRGTSAAPNNGDGPTRDQCIVKYWECYWENWNDVSGSSIWNGLKTLTSAINLDLENVEEQVDEYKEKMDECLGEACARILAQ